MSPFALRLRRLNAPEQFLHFQRWSPRHPVILVAPGYVRPATRAEDRELQPAGHHRRADPNILVTAGSSGTIPETRARPLSIPDGPEIPLELVADDGDAAIVARQRDSPELTDGLPAGHRRRVQESRARVVHRGHQSVAASLVTLTRGPAAESAGRHRPDVAHATAHNAPEGYTMTVR